MTNTQVNVTQKDIEIASSEKTFTANGDLTTLLNVGISPGKNTIDASGTAAKVTYDFAVGSGGATGPVTANIRYRSITVPINLHTSPQEVTDFFTDVNVVNLAELHVFARLVTDVNIIYDLFFTNTTASGTIDPDLTISTLEVPPGKFPSPINVGNPVKFINSVLRTVKNDGTRVYDVFILD